MLLNAIKNNRLGLASELTKRVFATDTKSSEYSKISAVIPPGLSHMYQLLLQQSKYKQKYIIGN